MRSTMKRRKFLQGAAATVCTAMVPYVPASAAPYINGVVQNPVLTYAEAVKVAETYNSITLYSATIHFWKKGERIHYQLGVVTYDELAKELTDIARNGPGSAATYTEAPTLKTYNYLCLDTPTPSI